MVVSGYWNNPVATAECSSAATGRSGDVGRMDATGSFTSWTAARTCSIAAATRSSASRWKTRCANTRTCWRGGRRQAVPVLGERVHVFGRARRSPPDVRVAPLLRRAAVGLQGLREFHAVGAAAAAQCERQAAEAPDARGTAYQPGLKRANSAPQAASDATGPPRWSRDFISARAKGTEAAGASWACADFIPPG